MKTANTSQRGVLLSVKPQYANSIIEGIKTIELRKSFPLSLPKGQKVVIYSSSPEQKVIGECVIKEVHKMPLTQLWDFCIDKAMISWEEFEAYFGGKDSGFAIVLIKPRRYMEAQSLVEYSDKRVKTPPQSYQYLNL